MSKLTLENKNFYIEVPTNLTGGTKIVKDGETLPSLRFIENLSTIDFYIVPIGDYDFKPNKKNPPTLNGFGRLDIDRLGIDNVRVKNKVVSKDGKRVTLTIENLVWLGGEKSYTWNIPETHVKPTPTEIVKEYTFIPLGDETGFTTNIEGNQIEEGNQQVIFTADEGMEFKQGATVTGSTNIVYSEDNRTITVDLEVKENIYYNVKATKILPKYSIEYDVVGCTYKGVSIASEGDRITIELKADENYKFLTIPTVNGTSFTLYNDKTLATVSLQVTENLKVTAIAEIPVYNVTYNLTNCILDYGKTEYQQAKEFYIQLKTEGEYEFLDVPTLKNGDEVLNFTVHKSKTSCNIVGECKGEMVVTGIGKKPVTYYTIKETITNLISDNIETELEENTEKTITYNVKSDTFRIENLTSNIGTVTIAEDKKSATVTFTATENILINGTAKEYPIIKITGSFINCSFNYADGDIYTENKPLRLTANKGFVFMEGFTYKTVDHTIRAFQQIEENTVLFDDARVDGGYITLNQIYTAKKEVISLGGFSNIYNPVGKELTELAKKRFVTGAEKTEDYGQFITGLYVLPFDIPLDLKSDRTNIILGNLDSQVETQLVNNYTFTIDLGTVKVEEKYSNVYDYINTDYILHVPFFNKVYLNSEYVVNQEIRTELIVDLYSGTATLNVHSTFTDGIIESFKSVIGSSIPFIQRGSSGVIGLLNNVDNFVDNVYIEVVRNKPYNVNTFFGGATIEYGVIKNYKDFIRCDNIILTTNATNIEKEEIKKLLKEGVIL